MRKNLIEKWSQDMKQNEIVNHKGYYVAKVRVRGKEPRYKLVVRKFPFTGEQLEHPEEHMGELRGEVNVHKARKFVDGQQFKSAKSEIRNLRRIQSAKHEPMSVGVKIRLTELESKAKRLFYDIQYCEYVINSISKLMERGGSNNEQN